MAAPSLRLHTTAASYVAETRSATGTDSTMAAFFGETAANTVRKLEECTRAQPESYRCWNDLAAARIEIARQQADVRVAAGALVAADRALDIAPGAHEALFNRATALEELSLTRPAIVAWRRYLTADGGSGWAEEGRQRMRELEQPTTAQLWKEARSRIERAVAVADARTVEEVVQAFPQEARTWGERTLLAEWAEAMSQGDRDLATRRLALARETGLALQIANGDELLADIVAAIDHTPEPGTKPLVKALTDYGRARELYAARNVAPALELFEQSAARFRRMRNPMARIADYYAASALSDLGRNDESMESTLQQLKDAPPSYATLRALLLWQRALTASRLGDVFESARSFELALESFTRLGERPNAAYVGASLGVLHGMMRRDADMWRVQQTVFGEASRLGNPRVLQTSLIGAAGAAAVNGHWDLAHSFYRLSMDRELEPPNVVQQTDAAVWRALAAHRLGWTGTATRGLESARASVLHIPDEKMRTSSMNRIRLAEGVILRDKDPERALQVLTAAIDEMTDRFSLPEAHLERGRVWRILQREDWAIAEFHQALHLVDQRERNAPPDQLRDSYFDTAGAAAEELIDLLDRRNATEEAFAVAQRSHARSFDPATAHSFTPHMMPRDTLLVQYIELRDRLIVFAASASGVDAWRIPISSEVLRERIFTFVAAIHRNDEFAINANGRELYDHLIAPLGNRVSGMSRLVIVADAPITAVPFAALRTPARAFLGESLAIIHAPSAAVLTRPRVETRRSKTVLVVGNPAFDRQLFSRLDSLPQAEIEAREIASRYASPSLLTGAAATPTAVLERMQASQVISIGTHALLDPINPEQSALLLASSAGNSGVLYLKRIAHLSIPADVVVLTGCRTAAVLEDTLPSLRSFAFAFLGAGSRNVLASLWDADDNNARVMSRLFHDALRGGADPAAALHAAQIAMIRSGDTRLRAPVAWSGFQLYGSGF